MPPTLEVSLTALSLGGSPRSDDQPRNDVNNRHRPRQSAAGDHHPIPTSKLPAVRVTLDRRPRVEDVDVGQIADGPSCIDKPPAQLHLLVAVEQVGEVPADLFIGLASNRTRPTKEERHVPGFLGVSTTKPRDVAARRLLILVDESECHGSQRRIAKRCFYRFHLPAKLSIIVKKSNNCSANAIQAFISTSWNTEIAIEGHNGSVDSVSTDWPATIHNDDYVGVSCLPQRSDGSTERPWPSARRQDDPRQAHPMIVRPSPSRLKGERR